MENIPDEEPAEYLEPVEEEIVENVIEEEEVHEEDVIHDDEMIQVEHEEVLEEIVEEDGLMYDTDGRVVEYEDMVMYEDETEVIEEYVEVEDLGNGRFAYVMTDEHGNRRLLKPEEVEAVKKTGVMHEVPPTKASGSSAGYQTHKRGRFPPKQKPRSNVRSHMFVDRAEYFHENSKQDINDITKIDVEKYVPAVTVNRRPIPPSPHFKVKAARNRKSAPWQEESGPSTSISSRSTPPPLAKDAMFQSQDDDVIVRFKCPECGQGFASMDRHCDHMHRNHDCQTVVREVDFFADREFENFLAKIEKATLGKEHDDLLRKKSRTGSSQVFVCNYMSKGRQKNAELVEVGIAGAAERPQTVCSAFVQKVHSYECIRVRYCDQHIHYDGNIGFRVPLAVKRRLFEMSFKRLPIACMQIMLSLEAEQLLVHPTRFEEKLKNLSHVEIVELLGIINASLRKRHETERTVRVPIKFGTLKSSEGSQTLIVTRVDVPKKESRRDLSDEPSTSAGPMVYSDDDEPVVGEGCDGFMEENFLYDPQNDRDPLLEELTETELGVLEAYERDIDAQLTEEQKKERIRQKTKFSLSKVIGTYQSLDTATHGLAVGDLHKETLTQLREMASYVVEICCQLDAEVKAQYNPDLRVDDIKRDMIAGIAHHERHSQPERRQRRILTSTSQGVSPLKGFRSTPARTHQEYSERILGKPPQQPSASFDMTQQQRLRLLREETLRNAAEAGSINPEEEKPLPIMAPVPDEFKAAPWIKPVRKRQSGPGGPSKKRGRPAAKKAGEAEDDAQIDVSVEVTQQEGVEKDSEGVAIQSEPSEIVVPETASTASTAPSESDKPSQKEPAVTTEKETTETQEPKDEDDEEEPSTPLVLPTTTRTGRVVKPKKWEDD
ncbi:hypothetical protein L5515_014938 [Caenorhabditis briggsae]|nr:hypothetical protein L5515_014938 [Caenorhabditis briggsae]